MTDLDELGPIVRVDEVLRLVATAKEERVRRAVLPTAPLRFEVVVEKTAKGRDSGPRAYHDRARLAIRRHVKVGLGLFDKAEDLVESWLGVGEVKITGTPQKSRKSKK